MDRSGNQHPVEAIVEWVAPVPLAVAACWAGRTLGLSLVEAAAFSLVPLVAGFAAIRLAGGGGPLGEFRFEPRPFEADDSGPGELLLEAKDELLELTDPLGEVAPDSRVVHLFERPDPTPGELVDRIAGFLGEGGRTFAGETVGSKEPVEPVDASDALHAALANIRASLR